MAIPSDKHKLLLLNSITKELICFISPNLKDKKDKDLLNECRRYKSSDQLMKSESAPSYWFAPDNLKELFKVNHPFVDSWIMEGNILVHEDSKSFAEFQEIKKPISESSEDTKRDIATYRSIFTSTEYEREDYILDAFAEHLRRNFKVSSKSKVKGFYCSMIAVLQSSGYGKSRLMNRFGGRTPTFYSSLMPGRGYPVKSFFLARLIEELDRIILKDNDYYYMNNVSTAVYIYILRMLFVILKKPGNDSLKNTFQVDSEFEKHKYFSNTANEDEAGKREEIFKILFNGLEDICKYNTCVKFNGTDTLKLKDISKIRKFSPNKFAIGIYSKEALTCNLEK